MIVAYLINNDSIPMTDPIDSPIIQDLEQIKLSITGAAEGRAGVLLAE